AAMDLAHARSELLAMLIEKSVCRGTFTLASGATSDLYIDCRQTTMNPHGALLVGRVGWELIRRAIADETLPPVDSLGGLTMGADPIALAIGIAAHIEDPRATLGMFTVRKAAKAHGRGKLIEGIFKEGNRVVIIDDVITTGGSTLQAIDAVEAAGGKVQFVLVLVDRQEGGRDNIEARGHRVVSIFTRADLT
ncbi:MAG TPA: orotate phosphoribosyltransferase, partial [Chthoniobacteraceae bacterium]|nr:orotate phosphoribosyltransferase [Chthoniobacteraceae bacterium]